MPIVINQMALIKENSLEEKVFLTKIETIMNVRIATSFVFLLLSFQLTLWTIKVKATSLDESKRGKWRQTDKKKKTKLTCLWNNKEVLNDDVGEVNVCVNNVT